MKWMLAVLKILYRAWSSSLKESVGFDLQIFVVEEP